MAGDVINAKQLQRLKDTGVVIESHYQGKNGKPYIENSDGRKLDSLESGFLEKKRYLVNEVCLHQEKRFQEVAYKYILQREKAEQIECPNCGYHGNLEEFVLGCPYCDTKFNVTYNEKRTGNKKFDSGFIRNGTKAVKITGVVFYLVTSLYGILTGRPYFLVTGIIASLMFAFLLYLMFSLVAGFEGMIQGIELQKFIDLSKRLRKFLPDFHYDHFFTKINDEALNDILDKENDAIDVDVLSYESIYSEMNQGYLLIGLIMKLRVVYYSEHQFRTQIVKKRYYFARRLDRKEQVDAQYQVVICNNCGTAIELSNGGCCPACKSIVKYEKEWWLLDNQT